MTAGCLLLFTGCVPHYPMEIIFKNLPDSASPYLMLKNGENRTDPKLPDTIKGTELEKYYDRDGWKSCAFYSDSIYEVYKEDESTLEINYNGGESEEQIREFCEKFREIRFAVMDKNGKILNITDTLDLTPKNRFGYPETVIYDAQTNKFTTKYIVEKTIFGFTPSSWWIRITAFSWITDILLLILLNNTVKTREKCDMRTKRIPIIILALPGAIGIILGLAITNIPYFSGHFELSRLLKNLVGLVVFNIFFAAAMISLPIAIKKSK